jgi:hypothetical protein
VDMRLCGRSCEGVDLAMHIWRLVKGIERFEGVWRHSGMVTQWLSGWVWSDWRRDSTSDEKPEPGGVHGLTLCLLSRFSNVGIKACLGVADVTKSVIVLSDVWVLSFLPSCPPCSCGA